MPSPNAALRRRRPPVRPSVAPSLRSSGAPASVRGFALLITITLVAFLVLILVTLATLTRVETQVAANSQLQAQARQNALMALNLALGQLQRHAGPDQRVTARADVLTPASITLDATTPAPTVLAQIDTHWRDRRNRHWTGVWRNTKDNPADYDPANPAAFNPVPELQSWLVSGNESTATFSPEDQIANLTLAGVLSPSAATARFGTETAPHRLLVGPGTVRIDSADTQSIDRAVVVPEIAIKSASVPGVAGSDTTIGHYAWWVGDEGVKARANLSDPYHSTSATPEENRIRLQSAQRPAIEAMTTDGADGLAALSPAASDDLAEFQANLLKVTTPAQFAHLSSAAPLPAELKTRHHDLSVSSRSVLADVKNGGLKTDFSYLFGQADIPEFLTALRAAYGTNDVAPLNTTTSSLSANPLLNGTATPLARAPSSAPDGGNYTDRFINTATWEQLWSFANQGSAFNSATPPQAIPRRHSATQHGIYPLVIQIKTFFRLRMVGGVADTDGINRTGTFSIDTIPVVLLANPYAVPLAPADYQLRFSGSNPQLVFGNTDDTTTPDTSFATRAFTNEPAYAGNITFVLRSAGMAPGEAQIFTIDPAANSGIIDTEDRILVANSNDSKQVVLTNEFDPSPALTFNTTATLPAANTRAALRLGNGSLNVRLYIDFATGQGERRLIQYIASQGLRDSAFTSGQNYTLVVDPMSDGIRQGGGVIAVVNQPPTTDNPAAAPGRASTFFSHQQAPFLQVNYRTMLITWAGNSTYPHPLEWARRFVKNGSTGSPGNTPNPWLAANLLRPNGSTTTARWGLVNIGEGQNQTVPPASIGGSGASNVGFQNLLYDVPRPGRALSSLGQLQHFNTAGYIPDTSHQSTSSMNSWQTNYPVSNSYPQPRVPRNQLFNYAHIPNQGSGWSIGYHFDGSTIWNDLLWDCFYFSTYPQTDSFDFASDRLINSRLRPFRNRDDIAWDEEENFRGDGDAENPANSRIAAANLLVEGAFNINSTSVEAWKAVLSSLKQVPAGSENDTHAPFPRTLTPIDGSDDAETGASPDSWAGFRDLSRDDIQSLAEEIVLQIRKRGPFTSLSEFVNRRLIASTNDALGLGLSGALQAALDRTVNQIERLSPAFRVPSSKTSSTSSTNIRHISFADLDYIRPSALAGFPGYVLQADLLSALGPTLAARSDTFTIRTYGDSVNPATGDVTARAWCEAVVQRLPDYIDSTPATDTPAAGSAAETFGRRFVVVSFRWLSPNEI